MSDSIKQIPFGKLVVEHFYLGVLFTLIYVTIGPKIIGYHLPGVAVLLLVEAIMVPLIMLHLFWSAKKIMGRFSLKAIIPFRNKLSTKKFLLWWGGGIFICLLVYVPLYPLGLYLRESVFGWLPEWYFNPTYGTDDVKTIANFFLIGVFLDGLLAPAAEELFFRGYLLPRMAYLKGWAPVLNGAFFGLYHFWQPHNWIASIILGIVFSFAVWKTKNVYVGIAIHCTLNILGALSAYFAITNGVMVGR